jgi:hypothetical protein
VKHKICLEKTTAAAAAYLSRKGICQSRGGAGIRIEIKSLSGEAHQQPAWLMQKKNNPVPYHITIPRTNRRWASAANSI